MSLMQTITDDLKAAMKAKNKEKTAVLRMVLSEFKYAMTSNDRDETLDDETALKVLNTYHKRLEKSLADYPDGEMKDKIHAEIAIVDTYLPKKASADQVSVAVDRLLQSTDERNFGVLMKQLMAEFGQSADGKLISKALKSKLG